MSLPTREQCESWNPKQVAAYLRQNNMRDCAETVQRIRIDGRQFLNLSDGDLNKFHLLQRPQLQKMVQDIKKNDDSLFNRLKRFQTEQTANILKTGRDTLDRIKKKGPPKVPARDYEEEAAESEKYSDSEFDCDSEYEDPHSDHDDSYELPPRSEAGNNFTQSITNTREEYVDSFRGRPAKPGKPFFNVPQRNVREQKNSQTDNYDEEYVEPDKKPEGDDDYIEPNESAKPAVNRGTKPGIPSRTNKTNKGFVEVPDLKESSQFKMKTNNTLQLNTQTTPPKVNPRIQNRRPTTDPISDMEYEVCDGDDSVNENPEENTQNRRSVPTPRPRDLKKSSPALMPKPNASHRDTEVKSRSPPNTNVNQTLTGFHRAMMPLPRQNPSQNRVTSDKVEEREAEEEAGVYKKIWYASNCDRRTAEDALIRTSKDGSFLLRKSSGVDVQQPYTLVVFFNGRVYNIPVRYITSSKQFALGKEKQGEERFNSVSDIIENHQRNPLVLVDSQSNTKDFTKLRHPVKP